jgi:hypothetical protein
MDTTTKFGTCYSLLYVLSTSTALIFIEHLTKSIPTILVLWLSAVVATIIMHLICIKRLRYIYHCLIMDKKSFLLFVTTVFFIISSSYYSSHTVGSTLYLLSYFAISGLISLVISRQFRSLSIVNVFGSGCYIIAILWTLYKIAILTDGVYAIILTTIGAISGVVYAKYIQTYAVSFSLSALESLAVRYWLVIILIPILMPESLFSCLATYKLIYTPKIVLVSLSTLILPLYFNQKALKYMHYTKVLIINALTPFVSLIFSIIFMNKYSTLINLSIPAILIFVGTLCVIFLTKLINTSYRSK